MDLKINSKRDSVDPPVKMEQLDNTTATSDGVVPGGESSALKIQVKQKPTDQTQLVISEDGYETVINKDEPALSESGRFEQGRRSVRVQSPSSEECNEGRVLTRPIDDVAEHDESLAQPLPLFQDDNINQPEGSLHPNQASSVRQSTEAPPENPQSSGEGSRTHICANCKKQFTCHSQLIIHERSHTGEKPFQCDICPAAFKQASNLTRHKRTHSGEKPFKCEICNEAFNQPSHLTTHQESHFEHKPHTCDICGKSFRQKSTLTAHMVTHRSASDRTKHKCNVCGKEFSYKYTLTKHQKIHLEKKPSQL